MRKKSNVTTFEQSLAMFLRVPLKEPGNKKTAVAQSSDNDGFFNGLYLGAMSLAHEVTRKPVYKERAKRTFRALSFPQ